MAPASDTGIASEMISVERTERRKTHTTSAASRVPSMRCSLRESTISMMNTASLETTDRLMPGGRAGRSSVSRRSWMRSVMATVLALAILTMPRPTVVWPLKRASWRLSARPSSMFATSPRRTGALSRQATISSRSCSTSWNSRSSLTRLSVLRPTTKPPASCTCSRAKASLMSWAVILWAAIRSGSRSTRMVRSRRPPRRTSPTPSMVSRRFLRTLRAYWLSCCWVRSPCSASHITGWALVSTLATTGGSTSLGSRRSTWLTLDWTSLKATSTFFSRAKVMLTVDTPGDEVDCTCSMPGTLFTADSMTLVMLESTMSGLAPFSVVVIEITGNSMNG